MAMLRRNIVVVAIATAFFLLGASGPEAQAALSGYLVGKAPVRVVTWLAPPPAARSIERMADEQTFFATRALALKGSHELKQAEADDRL